MFLGWVVRKLVNAIAGLKFNQSINFSSVYKMFFTAQSNSFINLNTVIKKYKFVRFTGQTNLYSYISLEDTSNSIYNQSIGDNSIQGIFVGDVCCLSHAFSQNLQNEQHFAGFYEFSVLLQVWLNKVIPHVYTCKSIQKSINLIKNKK